MRLHSCNRFAATCRSDLFIGRCVELFFIASGEMGPN
jgi:hypothetical protein